MLNKKTISRIAFAMMLCILLSALSGCKKDTVAATVPTQDTTPSVADTTPQADVNAEEGWQIEQEGSLKAWKLTPVAWSSNNGAAVTVTAQPREYQDQMGASFVVRLGAEEVENRSCDWDGSAFVATADLSAEDGYEYELVLFQPQKSGETIVPGEHITLTDAYLYLANLKSSLEPACTLLVDDYKAEGESFDILACFATVRLPQLSATGAAVTIEKAQMMLLLNGTEVESKNLELKPDAENPGSYTASGAAVSFAMPAMEDDYYLDLTMNITLSSGEVLTAQGGTWYYNNGALSTMNAG